MRKLSVSLLLSVVLVLVIDCTTFKASGLAYVPAGAQNTVLGDFYVELWVDEFLGSSGGAKLGNIAADATEPLIREAIEAAIKAKGGSGAINITIVHRATLVDIILNSITTGLYAPSQVVVSGTVIK
jgi:hypothetical protein